MTQPISPPNMTTLPIPEVGPPTVRPPADSWFTPPTLVSTLETENVAGDPIRVESSPVPEVEYAAVLFRVGEGWRVAMVRAENVVEYVTYVDDEMRTVVASITVTDVSRPVIGDQREAFAALAEQLTLADQDYHRPPD